MPFGSGGQNIGALAQGIADASNVTADIVQAEIENHKLNTENLQNLLQPPHPRHTLPIPNFGTSQCPSPALLAANLQHSPAPVHGASRSPIAAPAPPHLSPLAKPFPATLSPHVPV